MPKPPIGWDSPVPTPCPSSFLQDLTQHVFYSVSKPFQYGKHHPNIPTVNLTCDDLECTCFQVDLCLSLKLITQTTLRLLSKAIQVYTAMRFGNIVVQLSLWFVIAWLIMWPDSFPTISHRMCRELTWRWWASIRPVALPALAFLGVLEHIFKRLRTLHDAYHTCRRIYNWLFAPNLETTTPVVNPGHPSEARDPPPATQPHTQGHPTRHPKPRDWSRAVQYLAEADPIRQQRTEGWVMSTPYLTHAASRPRSAAQIDMKPIKVNTRSGSYFTFSNKSTRAYSFTTPAQHS